jgi:hypothetical protein
MSPRNHANCVGNYCDAVLSDHVRSLLAQFGLTPKSRRGLAASDPGRRWIRSLRCDRLAKNQPAEITMFQISEV